MSPWVAAPTAPGQQARHPLPHHGGDGPVGDLALEEGEPLGEAVGLRRARRASPPPSAAAPAAVRRRGGPVPRHPARDGIVPAQVRQRLGDHRPVIGQADRAVAGCGGGEDASGRRRGPPFPSPQYGELRLRVPGLAAATIRPLDDGRSDGDDAATARIADHRVLGPGAGRHHHGPGRPRRGRDQGRAARRRLHPRDDVAHRRGHLAHAPPPQPGQALAGARPAHRRRRRHSEGTGHRRRRRGRGHAAGSAGRRGVGYDDLRSSTPRSSSAPSRATA